MGNYYRRRVSLVNNSVVRVRQYYDGDTIPISDATGSLCTLNTSAVAPTTFTFDDNFRVGATFDIFITEKSGGQTITLNVPVGKSINLLGHTSITPHVYGADLHKIVVVSSDLMVCDGL